MSVPLPLDESLRLDALEKQQIIDTPVDESFERIVRLACAATETPIGLISFVDSEREWFKARKGLEAEETLRQHAFCAHHLLATYKFSCSYFNDWVIAFRIEENKLVVHDIIPGSLLF